MDVRLADGTTLFVAEAGSGFPLFVLHGGPGFDHTMLRPWLDPLGEDFRLLYVDERGQGRNDRVDPATLTLEVFAHDVDLLADALGLHAFAVLGHSFGAIIATAHAVELGTAAAYVISGGGDSSAALLADVEASLEAMGERGQPIAESWEREKSARTEQDVAEIWESQAPFHFAGEPIALSTDVVYSPDVLRHFASQGYGDFDFLPYLHHVRKPALVVVGEHDRSTTPRAARALHEGIAGSELVVLPGAGHMSYIEAQREYLSTVRDFLRRSVHAP